MEQISLNSKMSIYLIGIGGAGMSAIAYVLLGRGFAVSGSDRQENEQTKRLSALGAKIYLGHAGEQILGAQMLVVSSAVPKENPEWVAALEAGIPVYKRDRFLAALMADQLGIAISGSHGKTTTTGMISHILLEAGLDPSFIVGGVLPSLGVNGRAGLGHYFVIEADEYDHMFLGLRPQLVVVTNVEYDHPDIYQTEVEYQEAFKQFMTDVPEDGVLVVCADDAQVMSLLDGVQGELMSYGVAETAVWRALDWRVNKPGGLDFIVQYKGETLGIARLRLPGKHNMLNGLAAIAVASWCGLPFKTIVEHLASFGGVGRRFELSGEWGGVTVIDDYAHHPTEIRATLEAAHQRYPGRRIWAVWQPHTFSRTKRMLADFGHSFDDADLVLVLDIYRSREQDDLGLTGALVVEHIKHEQVYYVGAKENAVNYLLDRVVPDDVVLTLGAGDGNQVGKQLLERLASYRSSESQ